MTLKQAVAKVLAEAGTPLHYQEITQRILQRGLWHTQGKTPEATVNAQLAVDIKRLGADSLFQRTDPGLFALRAWGLPDVAAKGKSAERGPGPVIAPAPRLSFLEAAERVLAQQTSHEPLHYREITRLVLEQGLVQTKGLTPEATLYAQVLSETRRRTARGEAPRFALHGKGFVGLAKWMGVGLAFQIEQHNAQVRRKLHSRLLTMPPDLFEALIAQLLVALGFDDVVVTGRSGDGGIDVRGTLVVGDVVRTRMAVQVKRWKHNVQAPVIQMVRGSLGTHEQGLIITTSDFSKGALEEAQRPNAVPVALMNGEQLIRLLIENDLGVAHHSYDLIDLSEAQEDTPQTQEEVNIVEGEG